MGGAYDRSSYIEGDSSGIVITGDNNQVHFDRRGEALQYLSCGKHHLRLGLYAKALDDFRRAMDTDAESAEIYYFSAIATLGGRKAFLVPLKHIRDCESLIQGALRIEPKGIFYYFLAYLAFDYYNRKSLRAPVPAHALLQMAWEAGVMT